MVHKVTVDGREIDLDKFRLRNFVAKLAEIGELEVHEEPVALADLSYVIESSSKAKLFKKAGAEGYEVVAATAGSRKRLSAAFGVDPSQVIVWKIRNRWSKSNPRTPRFIRW
jgi:2,5-furandicarboxylate decarboxylase 1